MSPGEVFSWLLWPSQGPFLIKNKEAQVSVLQGVSGLSLILGGGQGHPVPPSPALWDTG